MLTIWGILRYQERGFPFGYVTQYNGFETGNVEVSICEGKVGSVDVVYVDDSGNPVVGRNETPKDVVLRSAPFRVSPSCLPQSDWLRDERANDRTRNVGDAMWTTCI